MKRDHPSDSAPWRQLITESRHPGTAQLDTFTSEEIVTVLLDEDRRGLELAARRAREIAAVAEKVAATLAGDGVVLLAGAGTSGRLGILEAAECPPTFGSDPARIRAVIAGGQDAVFKAREGAEDRDDDGRDSAASLGPGDLLIAISASSVTPYVRGALAEARRRGASTVLLTCAGPEGLKELAEHVLALETGPEVLTGSTRLKAGSATKAVLNAITTAAMVRLGKVYQNLMVDLRPGSAKLRDRALRIVEIAGEVDAAFAERLYRAADGEVKTAIVMARSGVSAVEARQRLAAVGGHVRQALGKITDSRKP